LLSFSVTSFAEDTDDSKWTPRDEDFRILQMRVEQYKLDDILPAYQRKDYLLVPLGLLSETLDLAINVDIGSGVAKGFVFKETNTFYLDTSRNEATVKGVITSYNKTLVYILDDDIYVDSSLLSTWFGINVDADLFSSTITFRSEQAFPFVVRMEREAKIARSKYNLIGDGKDYPRHYEPYDLLDVPFIDQIFEGTRRQGNGESLGTFRSTTYMTTDMLGMESSLFMFLTDDSELNDYRVTLGKKDPENSLLGFAQASEYAMGHISEPRLKNITIPGDQEPGALISSFPLNQQAEYDRHRFRGNLLPGWEVELYHNDRLIGYQSTPVDGQYDFDEVPILFGRNYYRLVFYGPQGQVREQEETFELGQSLTPKGKRYYRVLASDNEEGGSRATAQYDIGLSKKISASFIGASIPLNASVSTVEQHNYVQAGLRGYWESIFASVDLIDDIDGGEAINIGMQTGIGTTVFKVNHTSMNRFFSEEYQLTAQEFNSNTQFRIDATIPPTFLPRIPVSLELNLSDFAFGNDRKEIINVLSLQTYGLSLTNQLNYVNNSALPNQFTGIFGISSYINRYSLRGTINYVIDPASETTNVDLTMRPPMYKQFQFTYGLTHSLLADLTELSVSASKGIGKYNLTLGARYNTDDVVSLEFRFSMGIGREPRQKKWEIDALAIAGRGSVSARVFQDDNQDGIFNEDDTPIENVGFTVNAGYQKVTTNENGIAFITGIPEHKSVDLAIIQSTLEDPMWMAVLDGVRIIPRPGHAMQLDFPIFISGEIDGTAYLVKGDKTIPAGRVDIEVVNEDGNVIRTGKTEYDGFYVISNVPLGQYTVRVSPQQMQKLDLKIEAEPKVNITAENQFASGIDFNLLSVTASGTRTE
jgi:hypothetical protein